MALTIGTNTTSLAAQAALGRAQKQASKALMALSTGSRLTSPVEDSAGYAISESLRGQIAGIRQGSRNAENAGSMVQVAEGSLNEQNNILLRMRELAIQAGSDTVSEGERGFIDSEFQQLSVEFDRIARSTRYGSLRLLSGDDIRDMTIQVGAYHTDEDIISYRLDADSTASTLNIDNLSVADKSDAVDSLENIDNALHHISGLRSNFGAIQERLEYAKNANDSQVIGLSESRSRIADVDVAEESTRLVQAQLLQQAGVSILAQANQTPAALTRLIG